MQVAAISYDSPAVLTAFASRKEIQFPLLSDADSKIIRSFDILNPEPQKGTPTYGIPNPGIYVLDANGVVKAKYFEDDYKERNTAAVILMKEFGLTPETPGTSFKGKHAELNASISDTEAHMGQHLSLLLNVKLPDRVHVYAPGVQGYIPIEWKMPESLGAKIAPVTYPHSQLLRLEAIQETVPVYQGEFRMMRDITFASDKAVLPLLDAEGNLLINGTFRYQACDDNVCYLPETVPLKWTVHYASMDRTRVTEELQRK